MLHYYDMAHGDEMKFYSKPVASAIRYIGANLYSPCRVSDVASYVGLEKHYFSSLFSKQAGLPPSKYILHKKLEESKYLLSRLGASVTDVAESLCFCDAHHFSRCFRMFYGMPPSQASRVDRPRRDLRPSSQ
jgi:AraC-like DNA-binding protein